MTIGLWFAQIWLESQLCVTTFPPKEMSLQLPSRSGVRLPLTGLLGMLI